MPQTINEYVVALQGAGNIDPASAPKLGDEVELTVKGGVLKVEERDNQDGTKNVVFKVKAITIEVCKS